jgi:protein-tyrosine phosphatase
MIKILFVCLGNICRSPLAEGLLQKKVNNSGLNRQVFVDSCGTSDFHIGELPDERTMENAKLNGIELKHRGRQFTSDDFRHFHKILVMDNSNKKNILRLARTKEDVEKVLLIRYCEPNELEKNTDVPDPFYGGEEGFNNVFNILNRTTDYLLEDLKTQIAK